MAISQGRIAFSITGHVLIWFGNSHSPVGTWKQEENGKYEVDIPEYGIASSSRKTDLYEFVIKAYQKKTGFSSEFITESFRDFMKPLLKERTNGLRKELGLPPLHK